MLEEHLREIVAFSNQLKIIVQTPGIFSRPADRSFFGIRTDIPEGLHLEKYPYQQKIVSGAKRALFMQYPNGQIFLNPIALGQIIASLDAVIMEENSHSSIGDKGSLGKKIDGEKGVSEEDILCNMQQYRDNFGDRVLAEYGEALDMMPEGVSVNKADSLDSMLQDCDIMIVTANQVEGNILTRELIKANNNTPIACIPADYQLYQFARINGYSIVHVWPFSISSFTAHGSFRALTSALKRCTPKFVVSLGVAFGADPNKQSLGDVIVAEKIIPYDAFNKRDDGSMILNVDEIYKTNQELLTSWFTLLNTPGQLRNFCEEKDLIPFKWYYGSVLSGGTVLSDINERKLLLDAASGRKIVGGEMEGHGIYFACEQYGIPCITIKGICDWGALKNGWKKCGAEDPGRFKDCVQAHAMRNAYYALLYLLTRMAKDKETI